MNIDDVEKLVSRIEAEVIGVEITFKVAYDNVWKRFGSGNAVAGRVYIQAKYLTPDVKSGLIKEWKGRKWYLSAHMTPDEVVKTAYTAVRQVVEHEIMEGFKVDRITLFNPHVDFEELLKISKKEVTRVGMSPEAKARDTEESDREYIASKQKK